MVRWILQILALVGFGVLLGFIGLTMTLNLFDFVDSWSRQLSRSSLNRLWGLPDQDPAGVRQGPGFQFARFLVGGGVLLLGAAAIVGGIVLLVQGPLD
ncbi:hypothetical protein AB0B57_17280 [Micromonospora sp. NPDC049101]|uniref:hypothetical protein n=1 Tax=Micromonospora sp. NPDC049101 TaxID=3155032 RepID=UPI00340B9A14